MKALSWRSAEPWLFLPGFPEHVTGGLQDQGSLKIQVKSK